MLLRRWMVAGYSNLGDYLPDDVHYEIMECRIDIRELVVRPISRRRRGGRYHFSLYAYHRATLADVLSPCRCNSLLYRNPCIHIYCNKELICSMPSSEDVLHARVRTNGVVEIQLDKIGGEVYRLYDVGGQRSERRKWIHLFEGVNVVITCAAIREYDHLLLEDKTPNRMMETKELFDWVLKQRCLEKTSFMLFLNKFDIFERKIQKVYNESTFFIPSSGGVINVSIVGNTRATLHVCICRFVKKKFEEVFKSSKHDHIDRVFKIYKTMALDRKLLKKTFRLIDKSMRRSKEGNRSVIDHSVLKFKWNFSH
ncbi:hypothetical protein VPH35_064067 [Triticum aestivum]